MRNSDRTVCLSDVGHIDLAASENYSRAGHSVNKQYKVLSQPKVGDALQLGSKGRYGSCVFGR